MKITLPILLAANLAMPLFAQNAATNAAPAPASATNELAQSVITLPVSAAVVSAPLVLTNDAVSQPETTDAEGGGKAVFSVNIVRAGNYEIRAVVNAPDEESNSFYINFDKPPEDPLMIWDIEVTAGFEERTVSWRGDGDSGNDEFTPKRFNLAAGAHKLIVVGREPSQLKSISIRPAAN